MTLTELRDALAKATGPDLDLNVEIMVLVCGWDRKRARQLCPHVTGSIDAAVTLLPKNCAWSLETDPDIVGDTPEAGVGVPLSRQSKTDWEYCRAATMPLAICLARVSYEIAAGASGTGRIVK